APTEPDPLLHVVREGRPHGLGTNLGKSAHTKPPQPELFFQPSIHKLCHRRPLPQCRLTVRASCLRSQRGEPRGVLLSPRWTARSECFPSSSCHVENTLYNL